MYLIKDQQKKKLLQENDQKRKHSFWGILEDDQTQYIETWGFSRDKYLIPEMEALHTIQGYYPPIISPERKTHCTKNHPKKRFPEQEKE